MDTTWTNLLDALESPSPMSTTSPRPQESARVPVHSDPLADSYQLELVVRATQHKRRLDARVQNAGKAFEDAICAYFFPPTTHISPQSRAQFASGLARCNSSGSTPPARARSQWPLSSSPLTPASPQIWLDSARRLDELARSVDLMLEDNSRERGLVAIARPRLSADAAKRACCYIGWLPSEILSQIFLQLPEHPLSVLSITHVNYRWREIALDIPSLFTSTASWDMWSLPLLEEWISRTKREALSVKLSNEALLRIRTESGFYSLVRSSHDVWEELDIAVAPFGQSGDVLDACRTILHLDMPLLKKLRLVGGNDIGLCSAILDVPSRLIASLAYLHLSNALITVEGHDGTETTDPAHSPRSLVIDSVSASSGRWDRLLRGCRDFNAMKLTRCGVSNAPPASWPSPQNFPNLTHVVLNESTDVLGLTMIYSCRLSNLRHITIKGGSVLTKRMWIALARCAPKLSTICIYHVERAIVEFLEARVDLDSVLFPTLECLTAVVPCEKNHALAFEGCSAYEVALISYLDSRLRQHLPPLRVLTVSRVCPSCRDTLMDLERGLSYTPQAIKRLKVVKLRNGVLDCFSSAYLHE